MLNDAYIETIKFKVGGTYYEYYIDDLNIKIEKVRKVKQLADYSIKQKIIGYHLAISIPWKWFQNTSDNTKDPVWLYMQLWNNTVYFVSATGVEVAVYDTDNQLDLVNIKEKIRQGDFTLNLHTTTMITDIATLNTIKNLGFQITNIT